MWQELPLLPPLELQPLCKRRSATWPGTYLNISPSNATHMNTVTTATPAPRPRLQLTIFLLRNAYILHSRFAVQCSLLTPKHSSSHTKPPLTHRSSRVWPPKWPEKPYFATESAKWTTATLASSTGVHFSTPFQPPTVKSRAMVRGNQMMAWIREEYKSKTANSTASPALWLQRQFRRLLCHVHICIHTFTYTPNPYN